MPYIENSCEYFTVGSLDALTESLNNLHANTIRRQQIINSLERFANQDFTPEIFVINVVDRMLTLAKDDDSSARRFPSHVPGIIGLVIKEEFHRTRARNFFNEFQKLFEIDISLPEKPNRRIPKSTAQRRAERQQKKGVPRKHNLTNGFDSQRASRLAHELDDEERKK